MREGEEYLIFEKGDLFWDALKVNREIQSKQFSFPEFSLTA